MALYRFGDFRFDSAAGDLRRGPRRVRLRPQPCGVLTRLLDRPGILITRQELHRTLWPAGTHVEFDQGLNSCVRQLRAALGDRPVRPRFIETLNRRGYRFVGTVARREGGPAETGCCRLAVARVQALASADACARSFAAVLDEEVMLEFSQLPASSIVVTRSVTSEDVWLSDPAAANRSADYLLALFVRLDARVLRVTGRLLTAKAMLVWAGRFDGALDGTTAAGQAVARSMAELVRRKLVGAACTVPA